MKRYKGSHEHTVIVEELDLEPDGWSVLKTYGLAHVCEHSPTGFSWGYGGSGPADLALSILSDVTGSRVEPSVYQRFKDEVVSMWPQAGEWSMTEADVRFWLLEVGEAECAVCGTPGAPSHDGSPLCRNRRSIAAGGDKAHCTCAACY